MLRSVCNFNEDGIYVGCSTLCIAAFLLCWTVAVLHSWLFWNGTNSTLQEHGKIKANTDGYIVCDGDISALL